MDPNQKFTTPPSTGRNRSRVTSSTPQRSIDPFLVSQQQSMPMFTPPRFTYSGMLSQQQQIPLPQQPSPYQQPGPYQQPSQYQQMDFSQQILQQQQQLHFQHLRETHQHALRDEDNDDDDDDDEDEEVFVAETQQIQQERRKGKQQVVETQPAGNFPTRAKQQKWTPNEEVTLVKAWIDVSEDPIIGNAQAGGSFWKRVLEVFQNQLGKRKDYRGVHQVNSKFQDINRKVTKFAGIYSNIENSRASGMSDADILKTAHIRYKSENRGAAFGHELCWDVLNKYPKWRRVPLPDSNPRPSKRTKSLSESNVRSTTGSSDARAPIDLNEDEDEENDDENVQATEPPRPIGRDRAKRPVSTSTGTGTGSKQESITSLLDNLETLNSKQDRYLAVREKELAIKEAEELRKDYEFYISPTAHLTGGILDTTLQMKEIIRIKRNFPPL